MKEILAALINLANHLDAKNMPEEANFADKIAKEVHASMDEEKSDGTDEVEEKAEEDMMPPMEMEEEPDEKAECYMNEAAANLKKIQLRKRARARMLLVK